MSRWIHSEFELQVQETGGGGDCLFHALSAALSILTDYPVGFEMMRGELANTINADNVDTFLAHVREDHAEYVATHGLNLNAVHFSSNVARRVNKLARIVRQAGWIFQGTDECVKQLVTSSEYFLRGSGMGVVMFNSHGPGFTRVEPNPHEHPRGAYLCVYAAGNAHWTMALGAWSGSEGACTCSCTYEQLMQHLALL